MKMTATINKTTKMQFINNGNAIKRTTKVQFGWIVEIVRAGEIVRRFECATMEEARRCE
jgi:L-arabinose isomerase